MTAQLDRNVGRFKPHYLIMTVLRQVAKYEGTKPKGGIDEQVNKNGRISS